MRTGIRWGRLALSVLLGIATILVLFATLKALGVEDAYPPAVGLFFSAMLFGLYQQTVREGLFEDESNS